MKVSKRTLELARMYARLEPEYGYTDMNAAIRLAKALLRATGEKSSTGGEKSATSK